jgi:hypothetical protein
VTVKKHLEHIFEKMGVETRTAAVAFAIRVSQRLMKVGFFPVGYLLTGTMDSDVTRLALMLEPLLSC